MHGKDWKVVKQSRPFSGALVFRAYYLTSRGWVPIKNNGGYPIAYASREAARTAAVEMVNEARS